jgi:predicted permease
MDRLRQDLIVALRRLRKTPGFTLAAIITLALGIGANTAIFTAVNALVFRPLPVDHPDELAYLNVRGHQQEVPTLSYPNYKDYRDRNRVFSGIAGYRIAPVSLSQSGGSNARVWAECVSGNYFDVLGVAAIRGRTLHVEDDVVRRGHPVTIITHTSWQKRFAGAQDIAGKQVKINGLDYTIVGVLPKGFSGTDVIFTPEFFVPIAMVPQIEPGSDWLDSRGSFNLFTLGRLKPGVTMQQAEASLNIISADLGREYPKENSGIKIALSPPGLFGSYLRGTVHAFSLVLMGVAALVLLIACVNLASLLLARAADRRKDTAIRLALGAARGRLIRQLLTESMLLSILGGAAGLVLAKWLTSLLALWTPPVDIPIIPAIGVDFRVMIFAAGVSILTGLLFGLAPALQSTRASLAPALKSEAVAERLRRFQIRDVLVSAQVALSVVLLVGSVLVVRSLQHALSVNIGFEPQGASCVSFDLGLQGYDEAHGREFQRRLMERVRALPGIESAGMINYLPLTLNQNNNVIFIEGKPVPKVSDAPLAAAFDVSPGYFRTARTKLVAGRDFADTDRKESPRVAIVNQAFVKQLLPGENPLGKRIHIGDQDSRLTEIVGVVEDGKYRSMGEHPRIAMFLSTQQVYDAGAVVVARSQIPEAQVVGMLRRAVSDLDSSLPIYDASSLTDQLGLVLFPARIAASVLGAFGLLAIVLASTGVYGIMAYAVSRRTREIGIRVALGANSGQVLRVVVSHTAILVAIGTIAGLALALAGGRLFSEILYGVSVTDPTTYGFAMGLMALVAFAACYFPARRAIGVDPVTALRTE